jgi:hypothetical protein
MMWSLNAALKCRSSTSAAQFGALQFAALKRCATQNQDPLKIQNPHSSQRRAWMGQPHLSHPSKTGEGWGNVSVGAA